MSIPGFTAESSLFKAKGVYVGRGARAATRGDIAPADTLEGYATCGGHHHGELYPDPDSCGHFFQCSWGTEYSFACPSILHFNPVTKVCDWPWDAGCEAG